LALRLGRLLPGLNVALGLLDVYEVAQAAADFLDRDLDESIMTNRDYGRARTDEERATEGQILADHDNHGDVWFKRGEDPRGPVTKEREAREQSESALRNSKLGRLGIPRFDTGEPEPSPEEMSQARQALDEAQRERIRQATITAGRNLTIVEIAEITGIPLEEVNRLTHAP